MTRLFTSQTVDAKMEGQLKPSVFHALILVLFVPIPFKIAYLIFIYLLVKSSQGWPTNSICVSCWWPVGSETPLTLQSWNSTWIESYSTFQWGSSLFRTILLQKNPFVKVQGPFRHCGKTDWKGPQNSIEVTAFFKTWFHSLSTCCPVMF